MDQTFRKSSIINSYVFLIIGFKVKLSDTRDLKRIGSLIRCSCSYRLGTCEKKGKSYECLILFSRAVIYDRNIKEEDYKYIESPCKFRTLSYTGLRKNQRRVQHASLVRVEEVASTSSDPVVPATRKVSFSLPEQPVPDQPSIEPHHADTSTGEADLPIPTDTEMAADIDCKCIIIFSINPFLYIKF